MRVGRLASKNLSLAATSRSHAATCGTLLGRRAADDVVMQRKIYHTGLVCRAPYHREVAGAVCRHFMLPPPFAVRPTRLIAANEPARVVVVVAVVVGA
jgi:hypothetical protein